MKAEERKSILKTLNKRGIFFANTFYNISNSLNKKRTFINSKGEKGTETTIFLNTFSNEIVHRLYLNNECIKHTFFWYSLENIINIFNFDGLSLQFHGTNSVIITYKK